MENHALDRMSGHANPKLQQFKQIATTAKQTVNFWAFSAVDGDAVFSELTYVDGTSALGDLANHTAYNDVGLYTGNFISFTLTSGILKVELDEQ
jgi:hypothetical protein